MIAGYAYSLDVLLGFAVELDLQLILAEKASSFKPVTDSFLSFIDQALNLGEARSMAQRLATISTEIELLEAEDKKLNRDEIYLGSSFLNQCYGDGISYYTEGYCALEGDVLTGYRIKSWVNSRSNYCDSSNDQADYDNIMDCPINIEMLNDMHKRYLSKTGHAKILAEIITKMKEIRGSIEERVEWHTKVIG